MLAGERRSTDGYWPILLKNSISADDEKMRAATGREARFALKGVRGKVDAAT